jgi:hypothetical protein
VKRRLVASKAITLRAIRGAWAVARAVGIARAASPWITGPKGGGLARPLMDQDVQVRDAMVRAWVAGYRHGLSDGRRERRGGEA